MIYAINYANNKFKKAQKYNTKTAYRCGVDKVFSFSPEDIDAKFREKNKLILNASRGNGYWLWKPYFIHRVMEQLEDGDCLIYADAGLYFQNNVQLFFDKLVKENKTALCQSTGYYEYQYTKRDTFVYMGMDTPDMKNSEQIGGTVVVVVNQDNRKLVNEWLYYACDPRCITDEPNTCGKDNYEGFIDHRHDQSIYSLLAKKYGLPLGKLYDDFSKRRKSTALLCYHHSVYGSKLSIEFHRKVDPYWWQLKKMVKRILRRNA